MPTLGSLPASWTSYQFTGWNTDNNVATVSGAYTMPVSGTINAVWFYCGGRTANIRAQGAVWSSAGVLLGATLPLTVPQQGTGVGLQTWNSGGIALHLTAGTSVMIGWWRAPGSGPNTFDCIWSVGSGSGIMGTTVGSSGAGNVSFIDPTSGSIGAYVAYTPDSTPPPPPTGHTIFNPTAAKAYLMGLVR